MNVGLKQLAAATKSLFRFFASSIGTAVLAIVLLSGCNSRSKAPAPATPTHQSSAAIGKRIKSLPDYAHFSIQGVAFYGESLFATTNIGLIEFKGATPITLHQWYPEDDVVEGPWSDEANNALWLQRDHDGALLRLDEKGWTLVDLPAPPKGYYSRGDVLDGFKGVSDVSGFRFLGGGYVWKWDIAGRWVLDTLPSTPEFSTPAGIAFLDGRELHISRIGTCAVSPCGYATYWRSGSTWSSRSDVPICCVKQVVGAESGVFLRGAKGEIVRVDKNGMQLIEAPGLSDVIARASSGKLIASFKERGIFILNGNGWTKLLDDPYGSSEGEHWAYLAERNGVIAYATTAVPQTQKGNRWEYSGTTALWVSDGRSWKRAAINEAAKR